METCEIHRPGRAAPTTNAPGVFARRRVLEVVSPVDGDVFRLDPVLRPEHQRLRLKAAVPAGEPPDRIEWWINGRKEGESPRPYSIFWNLRPGSFTIKAAAVRNGKRTESAPVRIVVMGSGAAREVGT